MDKEKQLLLTYLNKVSYFMALSYIRDLNSHMGYTYISKDEIQKSDLGIENQNSNLEIEFEILKLKIKFENQKAEMENVIQISEMEYQKQYMKLLSQNSKKN